MATTTIRYKSLPLNKAPKGHKYRKGEWYKEENFIGLCDKGFHCSKNIVDAMSYVTPGWVAKVEVRGQSDVEVRKEAWSEIRIIEWHKWNKEDSLSLAIFAAELVIDIYEKECPNDKRPRNAVEATKRVLKSNTAKNRAAAEAAAEAAGAAWAAAGAAVECAWAARAVWAARAAARGARAAARAAEAAAGAAEAAAGAAEAAAEAAGAANKFAVLNECHDFIIERKFSNDNYSEAKQ